jgi:murein L,D-transpeptidase YcbB/YkuD
VKFDSPNPFGVYMHDTPARALFARAERALSHGCVRLERPRDVAAALLRPQGWVMSDIDAAIATGVTTRIELAAPVPAFFLYQTARVEAGRLRLFADIYGWDAALAALLDPAASPPATQAAAADTMCAALPAGAAARQTSAPRRSR